MTGPPSAAQNDEQDFSIPGSDDEADQGGVAAAPPAGMPQDAPAGPPAAPQQGQAPQGAPDWQSPPPAPKVSGKAQFFGNLLKTLMQGVQNAPGNPNNAFDRGFMNASPQNQQRQQAQTAVMESDADKAKAQAAIAGAQAIIYKGLVQQLPQKLQNEHMDAVDKFSKYLTDEGADVAATSDDPKAASAEVMSMNSNDPRSTNHLGRFQLLSDPQADGSRKWAVTFIPNKQVLQHDFDDDENDVHLKAGMPMGAGFAEMISKAKKSAQDDVKAQHKVFDLSEATPEDILSKQSRMQEELDDNTPFAQNNKAHLQSEVARLASLHKTVQADKVAQAGATATKVTIAKGNAAKAGKYYTYADDEGTHLTTGDKLPEDVDATPIKDPQQLMAGAHAGNTVQQSLNRLRDNITAHPELFDSNEARDIINSATGEIDKAGAGAGGISVALPQTFWDKISSRSQNSISDPKTRDAVQQYIADYKAAKDKALVMQMAMQGGKIGRGGAQAFGSIINQLPGGNTATSKAAIRQLDDLQKTQDELTKQYPDKYQDFKKEPVSKGAPKAAAAGDEKFIKISPSGKYGWNGKQWVERKPN